MNKLYLGWLVSCIGKNRISVDLEGDLLNMSNVIEYRGPADLGV